jgi:hypothetical protein
MNAASVLIIGRIHAEQSRTRLQTAHIDKLICPLRVGDGQTKENK